MTAYAVLAYGSFLGSNPDGKEWPPAIEALYEDEQGNLPVRLFVNGRPAGPEQGLVLYVADTMVHVGGQEALAVSSLLSGNPNPVDVAAFQAWCRDNHLDVTPPDWILCALDDDCFPT